MTFISEFAKRRDGATSIEYGMIAAGLATAILGAALLSGDGLTMPFNQVVAAFGG
jgi:Flp pilus assembly pilin Flp